MTSSPESHEAHGVKVSSCSNFYLKPNAGSGLAAPFHWAPQIHTTSSAISKHDFHLRICANLLLRAGIAVAILIS